MLNDIMKVVSFLAIVFCLFGTSTMMCHATDGLRVLRGTGGNDENESDGLEDGASMIVVASVSATCGIG